MKSCYFEPLTISLADCGFGVGDSGCGTRQNFTSQCGRISVEHGSSTSGDDVTEETPICDWFIEVEEGMKINLTFTEVYLTDTGKRREIPISSRNLLFCI